MGGRGPGPLVDSPIENGFGPGGLSSLERAIAVLEACSVSNRPLTLTDIVRRTDLPKTTAHRMCAKLVELGMLERVASGYRIGLKVYALGSTNHGLRLLRTKAMPHLHDLVEATGRAAILAVPQSGRVLVIDEVVGNEQWRPMRRMAGSTMPLHATSVGKALLAAFSDEGVDEVIARGLTPYTGRTIVRAEQLREEVNAIRRTGLAFSQEEFLIGTSGLATNIVVNGTVFGAIGAVGDPGENSLRHCAAALKVAAAAVGRALAASPSGLEFGPRGA